MHVVTSTKKNEQHSDTIRALREDNKQLSARVEELTRSLNIMKKKQRLTHEKVHALMQDITHYKKQLSD